MRHKRSGSVGGVRSKPLIALNSPKPLLGNCNLSLPNGNNGLSGWSNPSRQPMYTLLSSEVLEDSGTSGSGLNSLNTRTELLLECSNPKWKTFP